MRPQNCHILDPVPGGPAVNPIPLPLRNQRHPAVYDQVFNRVVAAPENDRAVRLRLVHWTDRENDRLITLAYQLHALLQSLAVWGWVRAAP